MVAALSGLLSLVLLGNPVKGEVPESHKKMLEILADIARRTPDENPWLGESKARELRVQVAELPAEGSEVLSWRLHHALGDEELRLGNVEAAIESYKASYDLLAKLPPNEEAFKETTFDLALAYLRLGENQNCVAQCCEQSCILPLQGGGIHSRQEGSRQAIHYLEEILARDPMHLRARWILNLAAMTVGDYPDGVPEAYRLPPEAFFSKTDFPHFREIAASKGLDTFGLSGGATFEDFDNDGDLDLLTSNFDPLGQLRYFLNLGEGTFRDATEEAGLVGLYGGLNLIQGDYNNDGFTDVFILRGAWLREAGRHPNSLLRNSGDGTFCDVTLPAGLAEENYPTQTAGFADYDNDGDLDLFVGNEGLPPEMNYPCQLFRNNGDETFTDVTQQAGVENLSYTKAVAWGDYDGDRFPDLYVSNLGFRNHLFHNNGDGTFKSVEGRLKVAQPQRSFPAWFWDYDNDGNLDLYVSSYWSNVKFFTAEALGIDMGVEAARLYRGDGKGGFLDVAGEVGLGRIANPMGANFGDLDNDGYPDFYLGTGYPDYDGLMPNVMYWNRRGQRFDDVTTAGGFGHLQKGHAVVFADYDNDGDQDVFEVMGGAFPGDGFRDILFENPGFGNHWIQVKLVGVRSNRSAIGARVHAIVQEGGTQRSIYTWVNSGGSFGANPLRREIGLGAADRLVSLEVYWPTTDLTLKLEDVPMEQSIAITEGQDGYQVLRPPAAE